jgi:ABC-type lipoprotein export system ATPase subunit/ABC-type antimicrobial peptide transport system permease subunit
MIRINCLNKYYHKGRTNEIHVINNTSLEFEDTGLVCILGESGSGKTTLLNTIGGLDTFHDGSITAWDITVKKYSPREMERLRNSKFAYIFQEQYLLWEQTVAYNISLALQMYQLSEKEKEERVDYVLEAVGMKRYKKRLVSQLSGGQQQRIAIARALVKSPEVIFADEPTGNLDEANTMRIMSIIKKISKDCLVILVTHEKRIAQFFADRMIYIQDGRIIKDIKHESAETYEYQDDNNLYLKEFEKESYEASGVELNFYHMGDKDKLTLNVVYINHKFYLRTPDEAKVVYLTSGSETRMVEDFKPVLDLKQAEDFEYSISRLNAEKKAKLSIRELLRLARENVKMLGRKQAFLLISFIITSALLVIAVADYLTSSVVDKQSIVTQDSNYITVSGRMSGAGDYMSYYDNLLRIYQAFCATDMAEDIYISPAADLSFSYDGFEQISKLQYTFTDFSYVTLEHIQAKDIICGRMPTTRNEIVIDRWLLDKFYRSDSILKQLFPDTSDFLELKLTWNGEEQPMTIVGICSLDNPTVYIDKYMGLSLFYKTVSIASLQQLQAAYPEQYDDITLSEDEALVPQAEFEDSGQFMSDVFYDIEEEQYYYFAANHRYRVAGTYSDDFGVDFIVDDKYYRSRLDDAILSVGKFNIYAGESSYADILDYFTKSQGDSDGAFVEMKVSAVAQEEITEFEKLNSTYRKARLIVTFVIFTLSLLMLFFTMKSNAMKRVQEISVYRLMGITGGSILASFLLELLILTSCTVLPVVLILSGAIRYVAGIPSLQLNIIYPWTAAGFLIAFLYAVNIIVGIIPVYSLVKLPPARMVKQI